MKGYAPFGSRTSKGENKVTRKIFDWTTIALTFALTMSALGVVGSFELGNIDFAGFFIGQAVCIAGIALLAVVHHLLSKKEKALLVLEHRQRAIEKNNHVYYSKER